MYKIPDSKNTENKDNLEELNKKQVIQEDQETDVLDEEEMKDNDGRSSNFD